MERSRCTPHDLESVTKAESNTMSYTEGRSGADKLKYFPVSLSGYARYSANKCLFSSL